jgi:hypothetical protein
MRHLPVLAVVFAFLLAPAEAQQNLKLEISDGRVNLDATSVPARQILAEWSRIGGTKVVGAEKVTGMPLTLKLVNTPERQALDIILRNAAGYMAAPRAASAAPGASVYDRILILPTSVAPAGATATASNPAFFPPTMPGAMPGSMGGTERRVPPRPPGMRPADADDDADNDADPDDPPETGVANQQPVFTFPQQPQQFPQMPAQGGNQVFVPVQPNGQPGVQIQLQPNQNGQPTIYNFVPQGGAPAAPTNGFGVIGSPTPGVIQQPTGQPGVPVPPKPPGGLN